MVPITEWHVCISGYTQALGEPVGTLRLWHLLRERHQGAGVVVQLHTWADDWGSVAELVSAASDPGRAPLEAIFSKAPPPLVDLAGGTRKKHAPRGAGAILPSVTIYGYSWGAGWGAIQLAKQLGRRGLPVSCLALCDPVYRHPWTALAWLTYLSPSIEIPATVRRVRWTRQRLDWPKGCDLVAADPSATTIDDPVWCQREHRYMDDAPEWHTMALAAGDPPKARRHRRARR